MTKSAYFHETSHVCVDPDIAMTFDEVVEKFWMCVDLASTPLPRENLDRFLADVQTLEQVADVRRLVQLIG